MREALDTTFQEEYVFKSGFSELNTRCAVWWQQYVKTNVPRLRIDGKEGGWVGKNQLQANSVPREILHYLSKTPGLISNQFSENVPLGCRISGWSKKMNKTIATIATMHTTLKKELFSNGDMSRNRQSGSITVKLKIHVVHALFSRIVSKIEVDSFVWP